MKNLGKLGAAAFTFASIANQSFAAEKAGESASMGIADLVPFALGALLIIGVLFVGYKMDNPSENIPKRKEKTGKRVKENEYTPVVEDIKSGIPYEADENEYFESDNNFSDYKDLNEETEYEEDDDVSLFSTETTQESRFNDIDDNISYDTEDTVNNSTSTASDFNSTMIFDTNELRDEKEDEIEYSAPVEGLDEKIDGLDDLDDLDDIEADAEKESSDAQSFINEINRYKEEADSESNDFSGFTTKAETAKEEKEERHVRRYTKKSNKVKEDVPQDKVIAEENESYENTFVENPSGQMDIGFLSQMEQNLKKNQEERLKKAGTSADETAEEPKKRGRKSKKED